MTQAEFLQHLDRFLAALPADERQRAVDFYRELIQDGMESGKSEEDAVDALGSPETAAAALLEDQPVQNKLQALDEKNRELACGGVTEILVDVRDHRLLRPDAFEPYGLLTQPERRNDCPDPVKWKQPDDMKPAGDHVVRWSEVDWNGHLNNTIYANYLCDYLPGGMKGKRITGFSIAFVKEAVEGETLHMTAAEREGEAFVTGAHDRGVCFDARLSFVPEP